MMKGYKLYRRNKKQAHLVLLNFLFFLFLLFCSSINAAPPPDFVIVVLPDTQYYSQSYPYIFEDQTQWIFDNKEALNIVYVAHEGDIVNDYDQEYQWMYADDAMSILEPDIPYGVLPGNHDQPTTFYNTYFGVSRFLGRSYYGGHYGSGNDNNYTLFSASGIDFIVINLAYDESPDTDVLDWADGLLKTYSDRQGIVVSHYIIGIGNPGAFWTQGQAIYDALRDNPNLFLMLCGHIHGEGRRADTFNGNIVYTLLADYQDSDYGGNGWLRILEFSPANNEIRVKTYSPWLDLYETDADSQFTLSYNITTLTVAYNDLAWANGQVSNNITHYTIGQSGPLMDYSTGTYTPVTLTVAGGASVPILTQGSNAASGTDAYNVFNGIVDSVSLISYSTTPLTFTFTGLDPTLSYEFVLFGNRDNSSYTNRMTTTTISDVEDFTNTSTPGATFSGPTDPSVTINNGYNTLNGYVARFTDIKPGADGGIVITVSSADGHFYANALMLKTIQAQGGAPTSVITAPVQGTILNSVSANPYTISGTATDNVAVQGIEVSTNGGTTWNAATCSGCPGASVTWTYNWTLPADGSYTIKSRAKDTSNNTETPGAGNTVTVHRTGPSVSSTTPTNGATGVALNNAVTINWNEAVDCTTVTTTTVTISPPVTWTKTSCSGSQAVFTPAGQVGSTTYTITATTGVKDVAGNPMAVAHAFSYTTVTGGAAGYFDDFSTDTTGSYALLDTWTEGGKGQFLYDAVGKRAKVLTGDNVGLQFSHNLTASDSGTFSIDFLPYKKYPNGGEFYLRLKQDVNNYYVLAQTDGYGPGYLRKVVGGVEVERAPLHAQYSQNNSYHITISFSPGQTTVNAFGEIITINANSSSIMVGSFEIEVSQQDAYFDNIAYTK